MRLDLDAHDLLTTTRSVRKRLDLDREVPLELVRECIDVAVQAPTGSNRQGWHWVVVTDPDKRRAIGELYRQAFDVYRNSGMATAGVPLADPQRAATLERVVDSAQYLADHMGEVPVMVIPCLEGRVDNLPSFASASLWGSLFPAAWSFMLAARERALGTCWTTLHLIHEQAVADIIGIPFADVAQGLLTPVAYTVGTDFKPAPRADLDGIIHIDAW
jgi:nitroreductase